MKKVILSHKRADRVQTHKHVDDCAICVPESQADEYRQNLDIEVIEHPDSVVGLSPKRQWVYEKFGDVFMLDDDIVWIKRVYIPMEGADYDITVEPDIVSKWIDDTYNLAREMGISFFGFNRNAPPQAMTGAKPIAFNEFITGGAFGLIWDKNLYFPSWPHFTGEDYWINALNAYFNRKSLIDRRITFTFEDTEHNPGGVADYRTVQKRKETYIYLRKHFGEAIVPKKVTSIKKKLKQHEKTLKIPF
ncbi:MAG: hypothetical protein ACOC4Y_01490 [bacterium]